jgi:single-stranded-DNA-specific exonuclease
MKLLNITKKSGLKALLNLSGFSRLDSTTVAFGIAPRINACGRMGFENDALKLFLTDNLVEANDITLLLNKYNRDRQDIEKKIYEEALSKIEKEKLYENDVIVVGKEGWHHGVIGIVSSKITEKYFKPSILLCFEDGIAKGSGRSIPGFDLHQALCKCSDLLEKYGGHEMAVGLSLKKGNLEKFIESINEYAKTLNTSEIVPVIKVDKEINIKDLNIDNVKSLNILEPFGEANKTPVFIYKNLRIDSIRALSEGKHLKLTLKDGGHIINAIGFNLGHLTNDYLIGDKVDVLGTIEINSFNGNELIQINLNDLRKSY